MKNMKDINEVFEKCSPTEDDMRIIYQGIHSKKNKRKRNIIPIYAFACVCIVCCVIGSQFMKRGNTIIVCAYESKKTIDDQGITMTSGSIQNDGEMRGQLAQIYITGRNIKQVTFSCKNQYIDFTDWKEELKSHSMEKIFTIPYEKKHQDDYAFMVLNWNPDQTIRTLTEEGDTTIETLEKKYKEDIIKMDIQYKNGQTEMKFIEISLKKSGEIMVDISEDKNLDFTVGNEKRPVKENKLDHNEEKKQLINHISKAQIEAAKKEAKAYYSKTVFKLEDLAAASEEHAIYEELKPGENIVLEAKVKKGDEELPIRYIILSRKSGQWKVINEGY